jgi:prevent-host-death family protein
MKRTETVIGVRELRARLSAYLRAVAHGKTVTIGDRRGQPVARLVPVVRSDDEDVLERLAAHGVIQRGIGKPGGKPRVRPRRSGRLASDIVIEDRA